ncbi:MAG: hypothetical protein KDJ62_15470 [Rhodobiaceae bacterium]|nr:hypothetical protein [Rhodobiaceae bacterium]MCC0049025.1 hypothetical protein [Rhodobiaceae bacterium]
MFEKAASAAFSFARKSIKPPIIKKSLDRPGPVRQAAWTSKSISQQVFEKAASAAFSFAHQHFTAPVPHQTGTRFPTLPFS